jgi:hypothetical protein
VPALTLCSSSACPFRAKHRQLPGAGLLIVANEIRIPVCAPQFEVPVLGREPRVEHLGDIDATVSKNQRAWRLLAAVTRVALHTNIKEPFFMHLITVRILTRS